MSKVIAVRIWFLRHKKELIFCVIIFFVSSLSFGLGYIANREFNHSPIIIQPQPVVSTSAR